MRSSLFITFAFGSLAAWAGWQCHTLWRESSLHPRMELSVLIGIATVAVGSLAVLLRAMRLAMPLATVALVAFLGAMSIGIGPRYQFGYHPSDEAQAVTLPSLVLDAAALAMIGVAFAYDDRRRSRN